jgi:hypothetical protein
MRVATATCGAVPLAARLMRVAAAMRLMRVATATCGAAPLAARLMRVAAAMRLGVLGAGRGEKQERKGGKGRGGKRRENDYEFQSR